MPLSPTAKQLIKHCAWILFGILATGVTGWLFAIPALKKTAIFMLCLLVLLKTRTVARLIREQQASHQSGLDDAVQLSAVIDTQNELAQSSLEPQILMDLIVKRASTLTLADGGVIEIAEGDDMVYRAASGTALNSLGIRLKGNSSLSGMSVRTGEILICHDAQADNRVNREACAKIGIRSMVVVPLRHQQRVIGVLKVYSSRVAAFSEKQVSLLKLMSGFLGAMLDQSSEVDARRRSEAEVRKLNEALETKVKERTSELEESLGRFRDVTENIHEVFWMTTVDKSKVLYVSPAYEKIWGRSCQSFYENFSSFIESIHPKDRTRVTAAIAKQTEGHYEEEYRIIRPDGSTRWVRAKAFPVKAPDGSVTRIVGTALDITASRVAKRALRISEASKEASIAAEQTAKQASRLKSEFLANMSHEIRTPLNGVIGMAGLLLDTSLTPQQNGFAESIRRSAESLLSLLNDILDFSKIEANKLDLEELDFDLSELVQDCRKMFEYSAMNKKIELAIEHPNLDVCLRGDPGRVRQILVNLISNAIKFTPQGRVTVSIWPKTVSESPGKIRLRFEVRDTGIGIADSKLQRLFQPFTQADSSTTRKFGGTGLGLSISKRLIDLMAGSIGAESREGFGSLFWFELAFPLGPPVARTSERNEEQTFELAADLKGKRILLAEDSPTNQQITVMLVENLGLRIDAVGNGQEAIEALRSFPYDLVLMDCHMPVLDGYEACRAIRESKDASFHSIPIIALTADAVRGAREACLAAGMNDYLAKPIRKTDVVRILKAWLANGKTTAIKCGSAIDFDRFMKNYGDMSDRIPMIVDSFTLSSAKLLEAMRTALNEKNIDELRNKAHALKGTLAQVFAEQTAKLAAQLEDQEDDLDNATARLDALVSSVSSVKTDLETLVRNLPKAA